LVEEKEERRKERVAGSKLELELESTLHAQRSEGEEMKGRRARRTGRWILVRNEAALPE